MLFSKIFRPEVRRGTFILFTLLAAFCIISTSPRFTIATRESRKGMEKVENSLPNLIDRLIEYRDCLGTRSGLITVNEAKLAARQLLSEGINPRDLIGALREHFVDKYNLGTHQLVDEVVEAVMEIPLAGSPRAVVAIGGGGDLTKSLVSASLHIDGFKVVRISVRHLDAEECVTAFTRDRANILYIHDTKIEDGDGSCVPAIMEELADNGLLCDNRMVIVRGSDQDDLASLGVDAIITDPFLLGQTIESLMSAPRAG